MWIFEDQPFEAMPKGIVGFVYEITDLESGKKYIGRKYTKTMRKVEGKTRRQSKESDWRKYYSSHSWIKAEAKKNPERFRREILRLCKTKGETNLFEVVYQFKRDVLFRDDYLNDQISGKWYKENALKYETSNQS